MKIQSFLQKKILIFLNQFLIKKLMSKKNWILIILKFIQNNLNQPRLILFLLQMKMMKNQWVSLTKVKSFKVKWKQKVKINIIYCLKNLILAILMKKNSLSKSKLRYRFPFWMKYSLVNQKKSKYSSKSLCKPFRSKIKIKSQIKCQIYQTFKK
jgi:hypothetical protein